MEKNRHDQKHLRQAPTGAAAGAGHSTSDSLTQADSAHLWPAGESDPCGAFRTAALKTTTTEEPTSVARCIAAVETP